MLHRQSDLRPDLGLLALRLLAGSFLLFSHGLPKLLGWAERSKTFFDPFGLGPAASLGLAIFAEVGCSLLVMLGAYTRAATVPVIITMLVAAFMRHGPDPWSKKEFPLVFAIMFLTLLIAGPGRYSLDAMLQRGRR